MKKLFLFIAVLLLATSQVRAQANIAGTLYASNFAQWTVSQGNNGPYSWSSSSVCTQATSGGVTFRPFTVGTPIRIVDTATPGNTENVTVTAVNINGSGCNIATSTPAHQHFSFYLASATAGLQEAINYSKQSLGTSNPASVVIVTPAWSTAGGTTTMITPNAQGSVAISILDERTSVILPYTWISTLYVAQPFNASALTSVTLTGDVTASISGPGAGTGAATLATVLGSPGSCGDTTHSCGLTLNGKGLATGRTNNLITGPTLGNTLLPLGTTTLQVSFGPAFTLPTISFAGLSAGTPTHAYIEAGANVFGWNFLLFYPDNNRPTKSVRLGVAGASPFLSSDTGFPLNVLNCADSASGPTCDDNAMTFSVFGTSTVSYGNIGYNGAFFTNGWTLGSLKLSNVTGSTQCLQGDSAGNVTGFGSGCGGSSGLSGMTTGQVAIAGSATTITSSVAIGTSGSTIPLLSGTNTWSGSQFYNASNLFSASGTATSGGNFSGYGTSYTSSYWNGSAAATDTFAVTAVPASGTNPLVTLQFAPSGSSGGHAVSFLGAQVQSTNATGAYLAPLYTPASSSATCTTGTVAWDTGFVYVCTATNTWKRTALITF